MMLTLFVGPGLLLKAQKLIVLTALSTTDFQLSRLLGLVSYNFVMNLVIVVKFSALPSHSLLYLMFASLNNSVA